MSNPSVITLSRAKLSTGAYFTIEDNLGESIHFHLGPYRFDLTVKEFLTLSKALEEERFVIGGHATEFLDRIDPAFLASFVALSSGRKVEVVKRYLHEVKILNNCTLASKRRVFYTWPTSVERSQIYKNMQNNKVNEHYIYFEQHFGLGPIERAKVAIDKVSEFNYDVVINDKGWVLDGAHRVCAKRHSASDQNQFMCVMISGAVGWKSILKARLKASLKFLFFRLYDAKYFRDLITR